MWPVRSVRFRLLSVMKAKGGWKRTREDGDGGGGQNELAFVERK